MNLKFRIGFFKISTHLLLMIVFSLFFVLKMVRAFAKTNAMGGFWNYIQIFFVVIGLIFLILHFNKFIFSVPVLMMVIFSIISMFTSIISVQFNRNELFDYFMIPYALCILVIACCDAAANDIDKNLILSGSYYIMAVIFLVNISSTGSFSTFIGATADVYYVLGLMPVIMIQTRRFRFTPMLVCGITVLMSGKRTGIIAYAIVVIIYYLYNIILNRFNSKMIYYFIGLVLVVFGFVFLFCLINDSFNSSLLNRMVRMWNSGDSSGRDRLWDITATAMSRSSMKSWLLGHGNLSTVALLNNHAHNDFLEILYDYGIFAFLAYLGFYVSCVIELLKMIRDKYEYTVYFIMSLVIALALAMFSFYVIDPTYITAGMLSMGYFLTDYQVKCNNSRSLARLSQKRRQNEYK